MSKKSLYEVIIEDVRESIRNNDFSFEKPIGTERSLSEKYSVSKITAKRALMELERDGTLYRKRGRGSFVCRDIFFKQANGGNSAPEQEKKEKKVVAFLLPFDITRGGAMEIIRSAGEYLSQYDFYLSLQICDRNLKKEKTIIEQLSKQDISALIYYPTNNTIHIDELMHFVMADKPVVIIDLLHDCNFIYSIVSDNMVGQRTLARRLIEQGHRKIAYMYNVPMDKVPSVRDRYYGFCMALKECGIKLDPDLVNGKTPEESEPLKEALKRILDCGATAIMTENDEVAFRLLQVCKSLGIRVPEDISIAGFDDSRFSKDFSADITTVHQDFHLMGELAAKIIVSALSGLESYDLRQVLPVQLIERSSTKAI